MVVLEEVSSDAFELRCPERVFPLTAQCTTDTCTGKGLHFLIGAVVNGQGLCSVSICVNAHCATVHSADTAVSQGYFWPRMFYKYISSYTPSMEAERRQPAPPSARTFTELNIPSLGQSAKLHRWCLRPIFQVCCFCHSEAFLRWPVFPNNYFPGLSEICLSEGQEPHPGLGKRSLGQHYAHPQAWLQIILWPVLTDRHSL